MYKVFIFTAIIFCGLFSSAQISGRPDATQKATFSSFKDFSSGNYITEINLDYMPFIELESPYNLIIDGHKYNKPQYDIQNAGNFEILVFYDIYKEEIYSIMTDDRNVNLTIVFVKFFPSGRTETMTYLFLQKGYLFKKIKSKL